MWTLSGRPQKWSWFCVWLENLFSSTSLNTMYYVVEQFMNLVVESIYSRHGEAEGTLNGL